MTVPPTSGAPVTAAPSGTWTTERLTFAAPGEQYAQVYDVVDTGARLLAVGADADGLAVWAASDDDTEFTRVHSFDPGGMLHAGPRAELIVAGDRVVLAASEWDGATSKDTAIALESTDRGATWSEPVRYEQYAWLERLTAADDAVLAHAVVRQPDGIHVSSLVRSTALGEWTPIDLAGLADDAAALVVAEGAEVWAHGVVAGPEATPAVWRSADAGLTFDEPVPFDMPAMAFDGRAVALPAVFDDGRTDQFREPVPDGVSVLAADGTREDVPPETGQWGDDAVTLWAHALDPAGDRAWALVGRTRMGNVHYCYTEPDHCWARETAIATSADGTTWHDVAAPPLDIPWSRDGIGVGARADGSVRVWFTERADGGEITTLVVHTWSGPDIPELVDPPDYGPPDTAVPLARHDDVLAVGATARYPLGVGGCHGPVFGLDGVVWETDAQIGVPVPDGWPYQALEGVSDGPAGFVFGTVTRTAEDSIDYSVGGLGVVATFHPRTVEPEILC